MSAATNQTMHRDHVEWLSDSEMWRDDIRAWQHELETARAIVWRVTATLESHEEILRQHAGAIRLNEQLPAVHEHVLKHHEQGYSGRCILPTGEQHDREAARHTELKLAHEQIKQKHHCAMADLGRLVRNLDNVLSNECG